MPVMITPRVRVPVRLLCFCAQAAVRVRMPPHGCSHGRVAQDFGRVRVPMRSATAMAVPMPPRVRVAMRVKGNRGLWGDGVASAVCKLVPRA